MLERLQKEITSQVVVLLEGGYNLDNIPHVAESIMRCLKGESLPNLASPLQMINMQKFKNSIRVPKSWADLAEENFKVWADFWPVLNEEQIKINCDFMINQDTSYNSIEENTLNIFDGDKFYKYMGSANLSNEILFYSLLESKYSLLKRFVPEFLGVAKKTENGRINFKVLK